MLKLLAFTFFGVALIIASTRVLSKITSREYNLSLFTETEKAALASLRNLAVSELKDDYMKEDYYLARYLLANDFKVAEALEQLHKNLQWRERQNISNILQEDWSDMHAKFPVTRGTFDLEGRPIIYFDVGKYDMASFLNEEESAQRFLRYFAKIHEESNVHLRQLRSQGKDLSQYMMLLNLGDFSLTRLACFQCLQLYHTVDKIISENYPYVASRCVFVNTPTFMKTTYSVLTGETQKAILVYGQSREQWQSMLEKFVHPDQFPAGLRMEKEPVQKDNSEGLLPWNQKL